MNNEINIAPYLAKAKTEYVATDYSEFPKEDVYKIIIDEFSIKTENIAGRTFYGIGAKFHIKGGLANEISHEWRFSLLPYTMQSTAESLVSIAMQSGQNIDESACTTLEGLILELNKKLKGTSQQRCFPNLEKALIGEVSMSPSVCGTGYEDPSIKDDENDMDYIRNQFL